MAGFFARRDNTAFDRALEVYAASFVSFEDLETPPRDSDRVSFVDMTQYSPANPEELLIQKEEQAGPELSWEARQVVDLIFNCPTEFLDTICLGCTRLTPTKIRKYLLRLFGRRRKARVDRIVEEVEDFLAENQN